jgi:ribosomal protein L28
MKTTAHDLNNNGFARILLVLLVLAVLVGGFTYYKLGKSNKTATQKNLQTTTKTITKTTETKGVILSAKTTKSIDKTSGAGGAAVTAFNSKDPVIYVSLQVNKPVKGTKFEYVRYYKGKYVDHKSLETTKDGVDYVSFSWALKDLTSSHPVGVYKVKLYTNGNFEKELSYTIL